jgi:hypothetical protein
MRSICALEWIDQRQREAPGDVIATHTLSRRVGAWFKRAA